MRGVWVVDDAEKFFEKSCVALKMRYDIDLVEEDQRVENRKGRIVQDSCKYNIFKV